MCMRGQLLAWEMWFVTGQEVRSCWWWCRTVFANEMRNPVYTLDVFQISNSYIGANPKRWGERHGSGASESSRISGIELNERTQ